ncbi:hypothetical protein [Nocardia sp. alder85J]|uniref:hypothetical protein n=1 Tax=Nocardia sp. alder85J TaxID=2862949 RepID=UPI001CD695FF|nr:hypothetical protein [Nocardia sp. alder85J]MCX4096989.1 hypothetical protein [Nocardia sp. alder85J]
MYSANGNKRIYGYLDPGSGQYAEAVTFTIPAEASAEGTASGDLAASPDLARFAVTEMINGQTQAGWIDTAGRFTAVTQAAAPGPFGGNPPSYSAIGFDGAGNFYYKKNSQGAMYTEVDEVAAGATGNPQQVTTTPPGAADHGISLNSDGSLLFGCENMNGSWLDANTMVTVIAPGTQIAKITITEREKAGCPVESTKNDVTLLPATNTASVHDPVGNKDGSRIAFFYDDPDRVQHNFPTVYVVGTDGHSQPTMVNLSETDAKKLTGAAMLRWS